MDTSKKSKKPVSANTDARATSLAPERYSVVSSSPVGLPSRSEEFCLNRDDEGIGPRDRGTDPLRISSSSQRTTMDCLRVLRCPGGLQDAGLGF